MVWLHPPSSPASPNAPVHEPISYPVPDPDIVSKYGITFTLEVEPHEWEAGKILSIIPGKEKSKRIIPAETFPAIMAYIEQDAVRKGYICDFD